MNPELKKLMKHGLWHSNPALVQILGLCPLLAISQNVVSALGLGLATVFVLMLSNVLVSLSRQFVRPEIRLPIFVLLIASAVSVVELIIQAFAFSLYQALGIYLPLIVTNCIMIGRAEAYAVKNHWKNALADGFFMGAGFLWTITLLGALREFLAHGTLFSHMEILFGDGARAWQITLYEGDAHIILAALPAGAFFCYALLIAGKNSIDEWLKK